LTKAEKEVIFRSNGLFFQEESVQISVVVPVRNGGKTINRCLTSLKHSDYPDFEVIVVDDCSDEDCTPVVEEYGFKAVRLTRPMGGWSARNRGAEQAQGDILVFVDCDMVVPPDALSTIHRHFSNNHYAAISGICGAKTSSRRLATRYKNLWMYYSYTKSPDNFDWFISGIGAVRREVFFELEGFDAGFDTKTGGGDLEFGRRLKEHGRDILLDKRLQAEHLKPYSLWDLLRNDFNRSRGWFRLIAKKRMVPLVIRKLRVANVYPSFIFSVFLSLVFLVSLLGSFFWSTSGIIAILSLLAYLVINYPLFRLLRREGGWGFLLRAIPLSLIDHIVSGLGVIAGFLGSLPLLITPGLQRARIKAAAGREVVAGR
jgi:glycosyltransferase involved in cell wall biosynthesis